ncbi:ATP/GTP-binding protein [Streptomyces alkaliterrae]|uniref:ATP/GTP-binding protein n=1 Tax=Streptomyces alkaliterrae TaxID=2213162 RepID=A0A5P0YMQ1_9ACTN|nr:ATP/GTP-binding protein [Streptomyces alkaliterrae]MBB1258325.1 ATP/GTP-binding protein [Streptomyces alkaliterrae]MQS00692.1 ATP/GTP-binding protein [Streptomyces alkaliterrae]
MAGRDLRTLFSTNDRSLEAGEAFTNRQVQWEVVAAALTEHLQRTADAAFDVEDLEAPRNNVLVFHGVGGIGKTTLSRKLEAALAGAERRPTQWGEPTWAGERILPVRIDLSRSAGTDFEQVVLTVRAALSTLGRPLPAFDVALRRYWEHQHPGESLEEYLRRGGLAGRFGKTMPQQLQSAMADVAQALALPGTVGTAVGQLTGSLVRALRERRQTVRALAGCARLADLLEAEPDLEALSFYPHLLGWELAQLPTGRRVTPVILLDTFEDVGDRTHRDLERLIQRVVWLMPNAFFIVTGRSRLQWADSHLQGQLDYTGPAAWPGLAAPATSIPAARRTQPAGGGGGRQVLIGDFSPEDCDDYLARRLSVEGRPLISEEIRHVITARSHGLPLYLDLSVLRYLEIRRTRRPTPADFDHDFGALIARTLSDLTPDERHVLRSISLLDAFDLPLATATAGLPHQAAAQRLVERPFVRENPFGLWPYYLHGLIRSTIRSADDASDDRWSAHDWKHAAERALAALGAQWTTAEPTGRDRLLLVGCLRQGLPLARDFHLDLGWLADAAWAYVSDSVWEPVAPPTRHTGTTGLQSAAEALVELLAALARRQHEHRSVTASRLAKVTDSRLLPASLQEMGVYYLAKAQRDLGDSEASRRGMQAVADGGGRLAPAARRGLAHLARLAGDFPHAYATARTLGWAGRQHRVEGDILWPHGDINRAAAAYSAARDQAEQHGIAGERATSQAQRALVLAFADPFTAADEIHLAEQLLTGLDLRATGFTVRTAAFVRDAGTLHSLAAARALRIDIRESGVAASEAVLELALAFHHAVLGESDKVRAVIGRLQEQTRTGDYAYYIDIAHFMAGFPLAEASTARWLDSAEDVRARWRQLVHTRQAALGHPTADT